MEERRSNGFRVKPSFGQVLGYIQEGEPLTLDLPNRKASIYTSSHLYLDDYVNAPEPVSEMPLPHTSLNPAAAFETADEGYDGVPFPRPPREFTRPSFLPDSDDGAGAAQRWPAQAPDAGRPHEGERHSGRGGDCGGGAAGAAAAVRSVSEAQTMLALRGGGDWLDRTRGGHPDWHHRRTKCRPRKSSGGPARWSRCCSGRDNGRRRWNGKPPRTSSNLHPSSSRKRKHRKALRLLRRQRRERRKRPRRRKAEACWQHWAREPWLRRAPWVLRRVAWLSREQALPSSARPGPSREGLNAAAHMWGATTGGGTDSDASRPSHATDVQTLNGMQESGAVDHFYAQEQRSRQQPQVFRIDATESEGEPQVQPQQHALRHQPGPHPRVLRQRAGQQAVPGRPGAPGVRGLSPRLRPAVLRRPSSGERT